MLSVTPRWPQSGIRHPCEEISLEGFIKKAGNQDRLRINLNEDYDVKDWSEKFPVSYKQLIDDLIALGNRAFDKDAIFFVIVFRGGHKFITAPYLVHGFLFLHRWAI